jgi:hypothetical protein
MQTILQSEEMEDSIKVKKKDQFEVEFDSMRES